MRAVRRNCGRGSVLHLLRSAGALLAVLLFAGHVAGKAGPPSRGDAGELVRLAPSQPGDAGRDLVRARGPAANPEASRAPGVGRPALPAGAGDGWWAAAQREIAASEYRISWQEGAGVGGRGGAYQAPNRAQGLRTTFEPDAIRIGPRHDEEPGWSLGISLVRVGPEGADPVGPAALAAEGDRVEYRRGAITETYQNDSNGLSQRITIATPPPGGDTGLRIGLAVFGNVLAAPYPDGMGVEILTGSGAAVLRLADLEVIDARGTKLDASLTLVGCVSRKAGETRCELEIAAETVGAVWPVAAALVASSPSWSIESNQVEAFYGASVAGAGDVNGDGYADVVVGALKYDNGQTDEGRAFVYHGSAAGLSTRANWSAEADQASAQFGSSVASAGDVNGDGFADVLVGAPSYDDGQADEGRAFLYLGGDAGLSTVANWSAEGNQASASFGRSVAGAGDVNGDGYADIVVGAPGHDNGQTDEGRAVVYLGGAAGPSVSQHWSAEGDQASASFGSSVASAGDVNGDGYADVIVGAPWRDNGQTDEGQAFVYLGSSSGLGTAAAWTGEANQASARYGQSVACAGDVNGDGYADVIVGVPYFDNGSTDEGRAFVYHGSASGLSSVSSWSAESNQADATFGYSVACAGDVNGDGYADVVVGAPRYDLIEPDEGEVRVYHGSASGVLVSEVWTNRGLVAYAQYGSAVAGAGDVNGDGFSDLLVGAPWYSAGQDQEGRAYVYHGSADRPGTVPAWTQESNLGGALYGHSVASAGDVNGDGWADVIVGAYGYGNGEYYEGSAFVYHGSAAGTSLVASWSMEGGQVDASCGASVAGAGDVNGDGYADVIVGCSTWDNGQAGEGRAFVYHGSASGLSTTPAWSAEGDQDSAFFGIAVAGAGDVNGDGYADVVVGAQGFSNGQTGEGRAYVYHGSASGLQATPGWTAEVNQANARFGCAVAGAGDVNGDGFADVVVGARTYSGGQSSEGGAFLYHGSVSGLSSSIAWNALGGQANAAYGDSVAAAGDVNGDGFGDVVVGAPGYDGSQTDQGRAFVYHGSASGLYTVAGWIATIDPDQYGAAFGWSVAGAGDVNGDGFADVLVGVPDWDNGESNEGFALLYLGTAAGLALEPLWNAEGGTIGASFGRSVAGAGDVNGDGYADLIVGADGYSGGQSTEGRASVFLGNRGTGRKVAARQLRGDGSGPVQPWGGSFAPAAFQAQASHVSPFGREAVRFEVEACPRGVPFGHASCTTARSPWSDSTAAPNGVLLTRTISGLAAGTLYRWRARTLRAPYAVLVGGRASPKPAHGPWWRLSGGVVDADVRTLGAATLDVSRSGTGVGLVTSDPAGIDCGSDCSEAYAQGTLVTLTATPAVSSDFTGWSGACAGTGACSVTMDAAKAVTATFTLGPVLQVTLLGSGTGTVVSDPVGISCGSACAAAFGTGRTVTLSATPSAGSRFSGWAGEGCSGTGTCTVSMSGARAVMATFLGSGPSRFFPLTPCRVVDTRDPAQDGLHAPILSPTPAIRTFVIPAAHCGIPVDARALSVNYTVDATGAAGSLQAWAADEVSTPIATILSFGAGRTRANNGLLALSSGGTLSFKVRLLSAQPTHFILDVNGYFR